MVLRRGRHPEPESAMGVFAGEPPTCPVLETPPFETLTPAMQTFYINEQKRHAREHGQSAPFGRAPAVLRRVHVGSGWLMTLGSGPTGDGAPVAPVATATLLAPARSGGTGARGAAKDEPAG